MLGILTYKDFFLFQVTYQNFGRGNYGSAECGAANMADTNWLVSHCEAELDWICKIPKGKVEEEPESHEGLSQCTLPCYLLSFFAFRNLRL